MTTVLLIAFFFSYSIWREIMWHNERKDLYNRLMSKNFTEYREIGKPIPPPPKAPRSKFVKILKQQYSPSKGGE